MKRQPIILVFILFVIAGVGLSAPAFGDHPTAEVSIPAGTSVPGCEETNECYLPSTVTIDVSGEITWSNDDTAAHTVTSGSVEEGPSGKFDSSLFMAGQTYSVKFDDYEPGEYEYFCMVHPWMTGIVVVQEAEAEEEEHEEGEKSEEEHEKGEGLVGMSSDGSLMVTIWPGVPTAGERLEILVKVTDADGNEVEHENHDLKVIQNGKVVLEDINGHFMTGENSHLTGPLDSDDSVDIEITLQGLGMGDISERTGPINDKVVFSSVVPEFGTIAVMIFGIAIVSILAITAKNRVFPKI